MKYNFIIPYRDREEHKQKFIKIYNELIGDKDCKFYFIHQCNTNLFNRGALLNIGFLEAIKERPDALFVFHDIDKCPTYWGSYRYEPIYGKVRKAIGWEKGEEPCAFDSVTGFYREDFEKVNGFPNYEGWGYEDIALFGRVKKANIPIDTKDYIHVSNNEKIIDFYHFRDDNKNGQTNHRNMLLYQYEVASGINNNGLNSIKYNVISVENINEKMVQLNVDFVLK